MRVDRERLHLDLRRARVAAAAGAAACLVGLGLAGHGEARVILTGTAFLVAAVAAGLAVTEGSRGTRRPAAEEPRAERATSGVPGWVGASVVGTLVAGAAQTWFVSGTSLAGGDLTPPVGTAWIARLFEPWIWSGSNLGGPNTTTDQLPWGVVDLVVHALGGSGSLAQRCWLTGLFVGGALAGYWLLRVLRFSVLGSSVGALLWVFNPYVLTTVGANDVYLAALVLVPIWPVVVLRAVEGRWGRRRVFVAFALTAPLAGFVYQNPPLVGLAAIGAVVAATFPAFGSGGRRALRTGVATVMGGLFVVAVASAYWLVPNIEALHQTSSALSTVGSWAWTEHRASIANGFWLNTAWGWAYPHTYFPYATLYSRFPLDLVRFVLPALAFGSLAVLPGTDRRRLRIAGCAALAALLVILFGTGTNLPGSILFDPVYHLPLGWLFREPGRFLMAAALCYATLFAAAISALEERLGHAAAHARGSTATARRFRRAPAVASTGCVALALATCFPLAGGALDPSYRSTVPAGHVRVPRYWEQLAAQVNRELPRATILVLPPDDFYQMPYTWGYYGTDGFITDLLRPRVLDPSGQGYTAGSPELLRAVDQTAGALVAHRWRIAAGIAGALGVDDVLVRGDVNSAYPDRSITSPATLSSALRTDPLARLVVRRGPLELFHLEGIAAAGGGLVATTGTPHPDLAVLGDLPPGSTLLPGPPRNGALRIRFLRLQAGTADPASHFLDLSTGWRYRTVVLPSLSHLGLGETPAEVPPASIRVTQAAGKAALLHDGSFRGGPWGPVGNCDAVPGTTNEARLSLQVLPDAGPGGAPALELGASADRACESETLAWHRGPLSLSLDYRTVQGPPPGICLWEVGPDRCVSMPAMAAGSGWHTYTAIADPNAGTTALELFLYATPARVGARAVDEYAQVAASAHPTDATVAVIGTPLRPHRAVRVEVSTAPAGSSWIGPRKGHPVTVDGLRLGWVAPNGTPFASPRYPFARWFDLGWAFSVAALAVVLGTLGAAAFARQRGQRQRKAAP